MAQKTALGLQIPLSLYVHFPWCVRKCPYCDFSSFVTTNIPQQEYITALKQDLLHMLPLINNREIVSIFFGGGTPSLFQPAYIADLLRFFAQNLTIKPATLEITLETNPGTINYDKLRGFIDAGVNRISLGAQSFSDEYLQKLGRIHAVTDIYDALDILSSLPCLVNLDIMYGLPDQNLSDALLDLTRAISCKTDHISWYNLTIEKNTAFYKKPPFLPTDDVIYTIQTQGQNLLQQAGFLQYEVSAFSRTNKQCIHNLNYWTFGDYVGLGAGAHSKITSADYTIMRYRKIKKPRLYLQDPYRMRRTVLEPKSVIFEFMLNATRLRDGFNPKLFAMHTGLQIVDIKPIMDICVAKGLLFVSNTIIRPTKLGFRFLNDLQELFL